ncbi:MAG: Outer membrane efflux protein [Puniceicoccaceae bacterium 5H]|nr:MAG: Outer membrane efflux protein [Puniceicoccaceae bacterium 5H]
MMGKMLNRIRRSLGGLSALCLTAGAAAQSPVLSGSGLEDYLQRALAENPSLQAARSQYEAARHRIPQVRSLPDPTLQVTQFVESVQTRNGPQEQAIMLSQRMPWFGKLDAKEQQASAEAQALLAAWQHRQLQLARQVAVAYYEYAYTGRAIELTQENLDLLDQLMPVVEERVRGGDDVNPLLRLRVETGRVGDRLASLRQQRETEAAQLRALLALPDGAALTLPDWQAPETASLDGQALTASLESANPELAMLQSRIEAAEAGQELARLEGYPDLMLGLNYLQIGDSGVSAAMAPDPGKDAWGVTVSLNLPVWRDRPRAAAAEAASRQRAAEQLYQDRLNGLRADVASSLARLRDAQRRLDLYGTDLLGLAQQAVDNSRANYEGGRRSILELIDSERSLLELQLLYWRAAADAWQQRLTLQALTNQPLLGTLSVTHDE